MGKGATDRSRRCKAGDWVQVKSRAEILATLSDAHLDGLVLMPQMLDLAGQRFKVASRAHKTCDTVDGPGGLRLRDGVHLEGVRCDGAAYDGCGAACLIFWKESWLTRVEGPVIGQLPVTVTPRSTVDASAVVAATRAPSSTPDDPTYHCQATCLPAATTPLPWWDLRQYAEDVASRNVRLRDLIVGGVYAWSFIVYRVLRRFRLQPQFVRFYDWVQARRSGIPFPRKTGRVPAGQRTPVATLGLVPGEVVRVKSYEGILDTLNEHNQNRGMWFDAEEVPYCGTLQTVRSCPDRVINEQTGKMVPIRSSSVILEGTVCTARYSHKRMFCPRAIYPIWREVWLERPEPTDGNVGGFS